MSYLWGQYSLGGKGRGLGLRRGGDELDASTAQVSELQGPEADGLGTHDSAQTTP